MRILGPAFPTPVGMNRYHVRVEYLRWCVPHARGDEPHFHLFSH